MIDKELDKKILALLKISKGEKNLQELAEELPINAAELEERIHAIVAWLLKYKLDREKIAKILPRDYIFTD